MENITLFELFNYKNPHETQSKCPSYLTLHSDPIPAVSLVSGSTERTTSADLGTGSLWHYAQNVVPQAYIPGLLTLRRDDT